MDRLIKTINDKIAEVEAKPNGWTADKEFLNNSLIDIQVKAAIEDYTQTMDCIVTMTSSITILPASTRWYKTDLVYIYTSLLNLAEHTRPQKNIDIQEVNMNNCCCKPKESE